jgi:predicted transcriptional regulator
MITTSKGQMTGLDSHVVPSGTGLSFRRSRSGPEQELVDWFLEQDAIRPGQGERVTIFREPRVASGFPDLVAVVWEESIASRWNSARRNLTASDLRVMHHLAVTGPVEMEVLTRLFRSQVERSLERLLLAGMVHYSERKWQGRPLPNIFAARRIVAIEAKVSEWRAALDQAFLNTWFTAESYILVPTLPRKTQLLDAALQRGIGVLCKEHGAWNFAPSATRTPRSYASWLFNEWAWRAAGS